MGKNQPYTTISIPKALAKKIDKAIESLGVYQNRSDFTRAAIRKLLTEKEA